MPLDPQQIARLSEIGELVPQDYFHGARSRNLCLVDNTVAFLRKQKQSLQQRSFETRPHHRFVLIVAFESTGSVNVDGRAFPLAPGVAFLIKPYQFHFYMDIALEEITWLFITFESPDPKPFEAIANIPFSLQSQQLDRCIEIANTIAKKQHTSSYQQNLINLSVSTLLTQLQTQTSETSLLLNKRKSPESGYVLIERINQILEARLADAIGIQQLAAALSLSDSHLRKCFKSLTGLSLGSYLVHYKLNRAVKLLAHSNASLTQISIDCGYESLAAFSRSFKEKLGLTPSQYRKNAAFKTA